MRMCITSSLRALAFSFCGGGGLKSCVALRRGLPLGLLLCAGDLEAMGAGPRGRRGIPLSYLFLATLGYPWAKTGGGAFGLSG